MFRRTFPTIATSLSVFLATLSLLFWQVRTGHDPALSANRIALVSSHGPGAVQTKTSGHQTSAVAHGHRHGAKAVKTASSGGGHRHRERESD